MIAIVISHTQGVLSSKDESGHQVVKANMVGDTTITDK